MAFMTAYNDHSYNVINIGARVRYIHVLHVVYLLCISSTAPRALFLSDL